MAMTDSDLTVTFTIAKGDVWIDPEGVSWYVTRTDVERGGTRVWFERTAVISEEARTVCRKWRQMGQPQ